MMSLDPETHQDKLERTKLATSTHAAETKKVSKLPTPDAVKFSADDVYNAVIASLEDSKAEDITSIDIKGKSALGDYMVVASGRSHRHVGAIADHLIRHLKEEKFGAPKVEGLQASDWVLIDTGDIIVHIFRPEVREFYGIEKMWLLPESTDQ